MAAQRKLLTWLYRRIELSPFAFGGRKGGSTLGHALPHVDRDLVITADIKSFFPSVNYGQVRYGLQRNGLDLELSKAITKLCTRRQALPQGAPTSAFLGNMVLFGLDRRLHKAAVRAGGRYTRYIDDLAFSGPEKLFHLLPRISAAVSQAHFALAVSKTRVMRRTDEQVVTGLKVNHGLDLTADYRAEVEHVLALYQSPRMCSPNDGRVMQPLRDELRGHASYLARVDPQLARRIRYVLKESMDGASRVIARPNA
jgi:RNA-directed DNA polymerase